MTENPELGQTISVTEILNAAINQETGNPIIGMKTDRGDNLFIELTNHATSMLLMSLVVCARMAWPDQQLGGEHFQTISEGMETERFTLGISEDGEVIFSVVTKSTIALDMHMDLAQARDVHKKLGGILTLQGKQAGRKKLH